MPTRYDVVVAGGGPAGCALAARLSEDPERSVCLVEAGPDYGPYAAGAWPDDILDARWLAVDSHVWERDDPSDRSQLRARILGGCSAHNACVALLGAPADYDEWGPGWTWAELEPYARRAADQLGLQAYAPAELSPWHRAFAEAVPAAFPHEVNARGTVRWNAAFAYLDPARERPNLTVAAGTLVDRVLLDGERAVGLVTDAGELRAGLVVLTAGAYGSPAILLRSGIDAGEGLCDHVGVGLGFAGTAACGRAMTAFAAEHEVFMAQVSVPLPGPAGAPDDADLFLFPAVDAGADGGWELSAAVFAMKPRSRGCVRLASSDPREPPLIDHGFLADEDDAVVLAHGVERLRALAARDPIATYAGVERRPGPGVSAAEHVRTAPRGFFHPTGTCAIGRVVDPDGRVLGFEGLVVADASIMPTIPRANTHLSTLAVAERLAERI